MKARAKARSEAEVTRECVQVMEAFGLAPVRRNVGGRRNPRGGYVAFGRPGEPDWEARLPDSRRLYLEIKREGWRPEAARGKDRERWLKQLGRLRAANAVGDVGLWTDDALWLAEALKIVVPGGRVELDAAGAIRLIPVWEG